jgi:hypothetical protein
LFCAFPPSKFIFHEFHVKVKTTRTKIANDTTLKIIESICTINCDFVGRKKNSFDPLLNDHYCMPLEMHHHPECRAVPPCLGYPSHRGRRSLSIHFIEDVSCQCLSIRERGIYCFYLYHHHASANADPLGTTRQATSGRIFKYVHSSNHRS